MTKSAIGIIGSVIIAGVVVSLALWHGARATIDEKERALLARDQQLTALKAEHHRLSNQLSSANSPVGSDHTAELTKLRDEAAELRKQTNALRNNLKQKFQTPPSQNNSRAVPHNEEYFKQLHLLAGAKPIDTRNLSQVMLMYASDHDRFPTNLNEVRSYLDKEKLQMSGTNEFDFVYQGSFDRIKNIPIGSVAVIRDRHTFLTPEGKAARLYGFADGHSQIVTSDDNFKSWEAEHILPPPTPGQN